MVYLMVEKDGKKQAFNDLESLCLFLYNGYLSIESLMKLIRGFVLCDVDEIRISDNSTGEYAFTITKETEADA